MIVMTKPAVSDFVRDAIREKASRELASLNQRTLAFDGVERARDAIAAITSDLGATASALAMLPPDPAVVAKLRRLRKTMDDATTLSLAIAESLAIDEQRSSAEVARASILRALDEIGLDPEVVAAAE